MRIPLQITFRDMEPSPALEERIRERAQRLERFHDHIMGCRVVVETNHRHHRQGNLFHVRIDVTVPDGELVASREPGDRHAHEDAHVAVRDAFEAIRRQLENYVRRRRGRVKQHDVPPHGRIREILPDAGYAVIATADGREVRFGPGAVVDGDFGKLAVGDEVRFAEVEGAEDPTASTVHVVGKHHVAG